MVGRAPSLHGGGSRCGGCAGHAAIAAWCACIPAAAAACTPGCGGGGWRQLSAGLATAAAAASCADGCTAVMIASVP
eukprot:2959134-Prymnesium_polylepis.1